MKSLNLLIILLTISKVKTENLVQLDYVRNKENYTNSSVCEEGICIKESARIIKWMNPKIDYCQEFYKFICGSFLTYKPLHERYFAQGIGQTVEESMNNNIKTLLSKPVLQDDNLTIKFSKYFFHKCMDRTYIERKSPYEFLSHVDRFGWGFPLIEGESWKMKNLSKFEILKEYPKEWNKVISNYRIFKGNSSDNFDILIQGFNIPRQYNILYKVDENIFCKSIQSIFSKSTSKCGGIIDNSMPADKAYEEFYGVKYGEYFEVIRENFVDDDLKIVELSTFQEIVNKNLKLNITIKWKEIFENILNSKFNEKTRIKVEDLNLFIKNIRWLAVFDDETFFNWFYAKMFYKYRPIMQFYSILDSWDAYINSRERNYQRHEQCIDLLEEYFPYVMPTITQNLVSQTSKEKISETFKRVSNQIINLIDNSNNFTSLQKSNLTSHLKNLTEFYYVSVSLPPFRPKPELQTFIENFNQNDTLTRFLIEGELFKENKLNLKDEFGITRDYVLHRYRSNLKYVSYPYFHPDRPRYLNDAYLTVTLFKSIQKIFEDLKILNPYDEVFKSYEEANDNNQDSEKHLPGLIFTNKQMYWIALTHFRCYKKKKTANIIDFSSYDVPYNESRAEMKRTFECDIYPGFENHFQNDEPEIQFVNEKILNDLGLELAEI